MVNEFVTLFSFFMTTAAAKSPEQAETSPLSTGFIQTGKRQLECSLETPSRAYFNNRVTNATTRQPETAQTTQKPRKIKAKFKPNFEKLREKTDTKNKLCVLLREVGEFELAAKMRDCSRFFYLYTTGECSQKTEETFHCASRHCPFCASHRAQNKINNYLPKAEKFFKLNSSVTPIHLILTQKHRRETRLESVNRILKSFRKLIRREFWKHHCGDGGIYSVETTIGRDGLYHTHIHLLVFRRRFFDVRQFRAEWLNITGDSINFKVVPIQTLSGGLEEVVGYLSKPSDVSKFNARHVKELLALKNVRLFGAFGAFRQFCAAFVAEAIETPSGENEINEGDLCPCHQLPVFRLRVGIEQRIELEKQFYFARKFRVALHQQRARGQLEIH